MVLLQVYVRPADPLVRPVPDPARGRISPGPGTMQRLRLERQGLVFAPYIVVLARQEIIEIRDHVVILWIYTGYRVRGVIRREVIGFRQMNRHTGYNQSKGYTGGRDQPLRPKPGGNAIAPAAFLPNFPQNVTREKGREHRVAGFPQQVPKLRIFFAFHRLGELNVLTPRKLRARHFFRQARV